MTEQDLEKEYLLAQTSNIIQIESNKVANNTNNKLEYLNPKFTTDKFDIKLDENLNCNLNQTQIDNLNDIKNKIKQVLLFNPNMRVQNTFSFFEFPCYVVIYF
jgi:hypothetical protein